MMQASTSLMLRKAFTSPGIQPHRAPASMPPRKAMSHTRGAGTVSVGMVSARIRVAAVPIRYWPGAPMLNRPVLKATATDRPVRISGVARKSMLPKFVELKPKVSVPAASRPVLNRPPNTRRMPSHALFSPRDGLAAPTMMIISAPTTMPMRMEISEASTDLVPSLPHRLESFCFTPPRPPFSFVLRRPYRGPAPGRRWRRGPARPRSRPHTSRGCGRTGS